jgi:hypothetical protein
MSRTRRWISWRVASLKVRIVPPSSACSGTMLDLTPAWNVATVTTAGASVMFTCRLTMVCSAETIWAPMTTGSTPPHGTAPCVWRPWMRMVNESELAMSGPVL